jgi:hypothetical protein
MMTPRFCVRCGTPLVTDAAFCAACGAAVAPIPERETVTPEPAVRSSRSFPIRSISILVTVLAVLVAVFAEDDRSEAASEFIDTQMVAPLRRVSPMEAVKHFQAALTKTCAVVSGSPLDRFNSNLNPTPVDQGYCPQSGVWDWLLVRPTYAILSTSSYVFSQGWASTVVIGVSAVIFLIGAWIFHEETDGGLAHPVALALTAGVALPIFTGLCALLMQLLGLALLFAVKYAILSAAIISVVFTVGQTVLKQPKTEKQIASWSGRFTGRRVSKP